MDPRDQLLQVAQELINQLVDALNLPAKPPHAIIQGYLSTAGQKIAAINSAIPPVQPPFTAPTLMPAAPTATAPK